MQAEHRCKVIADFLGRIANQCTVNADGSRNIKIVDLYMQRCMNAIMYGAFPRRAYQTGAALTTTTTECQTEWTESTIGFAATTNDVVVNESVDLCFENYFAYEQGRRVSNLYTKNLSTCTIAFNFVALSNIIQDGYAGVAPTYSNIAITITPTIIENREADITSNAFDFVETYMTKSFTGQTTQFSVDLNTGNRLLGLGLLARNGDTYKTLSDIAVTDLSLLINGSTSVFTSNFRQLQNDNQSRYRVTDKYESRVSCDARIRFHESHEKRVYLFGYRYSIAKRGFTASIASIDCQQLGHRPRYLYQCSNSRAFTATTYSGSCKTVIRNKLRGHLN